MIVAQRNATQRNGLGDMGGRYGDWCTPRPQVALLVTLIERESGFSVIVKVVNKTAQAVSQAITTALEPLNKAWVHTLTYDNGKEFAWHK